MLLVGPPGSGKTLLAQAMLGILPKMTIDEALDVTRIYSVTDLLPPDHCWVCEGQACSLYISHDYA